MIRVTLRSATLECTAARRGARRVVRTFIHPGDGAVCGAVSVRGHRRVRLGVDAGNTTHAVRLSERAGMRVAHAHEIRERLSL